MASPLLTNTIILPPPPLWSFSSVRFQMILLIAGIMCVFALLRGSMSMALVDMIREKDDGLLLNLNQSTVEVDPQKTLSVEITDVDSEEKSDDWLKVGWTVEEQARIHTSFYIGALVAVFVADALTKRLGAKNLLSFAMVLNVVGALLIPPVVIFLRNYLFLVVIRAIMGFGSGFVVPCGSVVIAKWFPLSEKSTAMAIFTTGNQIGIGISMLLTAKICEMPFLDGWPLAFFAYAAASLAMLIFWMTRAADKPRNSNFIAASELEYIMGRRLKRTRAHTVQLKTPYKKILLSPCVFAICLCSFAQSFVLVGFITYLPRYYQLALHMNIATNGIWSAVPFFVQMITKLAFGTIADAVKKRRTSVSIVTKTCNGIASFGTAICVLLISLLDSEQSSLVLFLMCMSMGLFAGYVPGYNTSIVSVAPQFTAFVSSYAQIYAQVGSTIAPLLMAAMTKTGTVEEWKWVFYMLAAVLIVSGLAFQFFGHGRSESWGEVSSTHTSFTHDDTIRYDREMSETLEKHNSQLRLDSDPSLRNKKKVDENSTWIRKISRVSYRDDDIVIGYRLEDLENDVISPIEEDEEASSTASA